MAKTILEIGFGTSLAPRPGIQVDSGDKYIAMDVARFLPLDYRRFVAREFARVGASFKALKADGLRLPLRAGSIDHVVMNNVLSEGTFPNASMLQWKRKRKLTFRQAIEALESELHRVAKPNASVLLNHDYVGSEFSRKKYLLFGKSRLQDILEVFSKRWAVSIKRGWGRTPAQAIAIKMKKKEQSED